jgi:hypothetical protein
MRELLEVLDSDSRSYHLPLLIDPQSLTPRPQTLSPISILTFNQFSLTFLLLMYKIQEDVFSSFPPSENKVRAQSR